MARGAASVQLWALAALLAIVLVYSNSMKNEFHFDDFHTVVDNPAVRSLHNIPAFFTDANLFSVEPANRTYRPVVSASLAIDYALAHNAYDPFWFHLSTLIWFLALIALLARLYFHAFETVWPGRTERNALWAIGTAAWFGLHPAIAETVNYVIQRGDIYCTLGCVAALVVWIEWPQARRFGLYLVPLVLALLAKPPAAVFPLLLLLWVLFFGPSGSWPRRWRSAGLAILPSLLVVASMMALQSHLTPKSFASSMLSAADYRMTQPLVWLRYFGELFLPLHLNVDTDLSAQSQVTASVLAGFAFLSAVVVAIFYTARRREWFPVALGLLWFVITQLPTSLYVLSEVENDHRMFFSFAGLMISVTWTIRLLLERLLARPHPRWLPRALVACGLFALAGYAWGAHIRNEVWRTEDSLWADDVVKSPENGRGRMIYGLTLLNHGDFAAAKAQFLEALKYTPNYPTLEINLGIVCGLMNDPTDAEQHLQRAIALAPDNDLTHAYYGRWLLNQGRRPQAIAELERAVQLNPARPFEHDLMIQAMNTPALPAAPASGNQPTTVADWVNRSLTLYQAAQFEASIAAAREALKLDPTSAAAWNNIAASYQSEKKWDKAIDAAKRAITLQPDFQLAKNNLAWSEQQKSLALQTKK